MVLLDLSRGIVALLASERGFDGCKEFLALCCPGAKSRSMSCWMHLPGSNRHFSQRRRFVEMTPLVTRKQEKGLCAVIPSKTLDLGSVRNLLSLREL